MPEDSREPTPDGAAAVSVEQPGIEGLVAAWEDIGPCKKQLAVEIPVEAVNARLRESMGELQHSATLPGFRRGHAPIALIEKRFGGELRRDVKSRLVVDGYRQALDRDKLRPIADPDIDLDKIEMTEGEALKFDLTVEVWPDFEPEGYEGMKLEKPSAEPGDEEIEGEINALRMRTTKFEELTGEPAAEDDFILCDYTVTAEENKIASAEDVGVRPADDVVGRYKVDGLKGALTGKSPGESVNIDFKIDDEHYEEQLRGKSARLALNVKGIRRANVPEATDEWATELGFESLDELRTVVARNVTASKEQAAEQELRSQVYDRLLDMMKFDLPEDAVRRQQKEIFRRERMGLQYRGVTEEDLAKISGKLEEASLERAERDLKLFFILSRIADKEGIEAAEADMDMRIAELAARYRTSTQKMRQQLEREGMLAEILLQVQEEKTIAHILSKAEISQAPPAHKEKPSPKKGKVKKAVSKKGAQKKKEKEAGESAEEEGQSEGGGQGGK